MKYLLPAMLAFGLPIIWLYSTVDLSASKPESAQLLRVIDGDTVEIRMANRGEVRIRLSGVDAPERDQPYGSQSTRCLKEIMRGGDLNVRLKKKDRYDRWVGSLYIDGESVEVRLAEQGCAWWYSRYAPANFAVAKGHYFAKFENRGLWAGDNPIPPWEWRRR
ncbi:MAG: thermonuclease family protein [Pseudomonadales bacterium]|nr:thermonuclease family protein [Pseudomonadales bacterium]